MSGESGKEWAGREEEIVGQQGDRPGLVLTGLGLLESGRGAQGPKVTIAGVFPPPEDSPPSAVAHLAGVSTLLARLSGLDSPGVNFEVERDFGSAESVRIAFAYSKQPPIDQLKGTEGSSGQGKLFLRAH